MMSFVCRRIALSILGAAIFFCAVSRNVSASTVVVTPPSTTPCKNIPSYPTIGQAVSSVPAGSTILICPGTYAEQVVITKNLTLQGVGTNGLSGSGATGANNPVITSPSGGVVGNATDTFSGQPIAAQILVQTPASSLGTPIKVTLEYLAIDGSNNGLSGCVTNLVGIYYQNASGTIDQVVTRYQELDPSDFGCQDGFAMFVETGTGGSSTVTIENSSVHDYDKNGITVVGSDVTATITGNYVVGIGATTLIAQNGIQVSNGANGSVKNNIVADDNYINPEGCTAGSCYGSSGILLWDTAANGQHPFTISGNTISNTQLAIVTYGDSSGTADWNTVTSNKIMNTEAAGVYLDDGIDLCSNSNTATSNTVFNSSGSGVHIDSSCAEASGQSGNNTTVQSNTINEACAGVLLGNNNDNLVGGTGKQNTFYNVVETTYAGDSCPSGSPSTPARAKVRHKPLPWRP
jgi:hypothetical protein